MLERWERHLQPSGPSANIRGGEFKYMNMLSKVHKIPTFFLPVRLDRTNIDRGKEWGDLDGSKHCFVGDG